MLMEPGSALKKASLHRMKSLKNTYFQIKTYRSRKIVNEFSNILNKKVSYKGKERSWGYVIFLKVKKLAHYLASKNETLNFVKPEYELRELILMK